MKSRCLTLGLLLLGGWISAAGNLCAEEAAGVSSTPEAPYVQLIPPHTEWTETLALKAPAPANSHRPRVVSISGYKGDEDMQMTSLWSDGSKTEAFVVAGILFKPVNPRTPDDIVAITPETFTQTTDYSKTSFPDLDWVDAKYFTKRATEDGHDCFIYERSAAQMVTIRKDVSLTPEQKKAQDAILAKIPPQKLWIDRKTGLPFKYDVGYVVKTYTYTAAEKKAFTPPPAFQAMIMSYVHRMPK